MNKKEMFNKMAENLTIKDWNFIEGFYNALEGEDREMFVLSLCEKLDDMSILAEFVEVIDDTYHKPIYDTIINSGEEVWIRGATVLALKRGHDASALVAKSEQLLGVTAEGKTKEEFIEALEAINFSKYAD